MVVGVNRRLAPERRARELAAAVGDHLVHVHVELRAAARHPHVQRKHIVMLAGEDLVADLNDQLVALVVEPLAGMVGVGGGFLQDGVGGDHLARDQILADAEVLERALGLRAPELVGGNLDFAEAVGFLAYPCRLLRIATCTHGFLLSCFLATGARMLPARPHRQVHRFNSEKRNRRPSACSGY